MNALEIHLMGKPLILLIASVLVYLVMGYWIPSQFEASLFLKALAQLSETYAPLCAFAVALWAVLSATRRGYGYWRWSTGADPACPHCGMMMSVRSGRYGYFWGCVRYPSCRGTEDY